MRMRLAAPLHLALCAAGCWCTRALACTVLADATLAGAARALCRGAQAAKQLAATLGGAMGAPLAAGGRLCDEVPMELLLPLVSTLAFLLPVGGGFWGFGRLDFSLGLGVSLGVGAFPRFGSARCLAAAGQHPGLPAT